MIKQNLPPKLFGACALLCLAAFYDTITQSLHYQSGTITKSWWTQVSSTHERHTKF